MKKLISCEFNMDTGCVELRYVDGGTIAIDCTAVEREVADDMHQRSELGQELETEIFGKDTMKRCALCGRAFLPGSNRAKYCDDCKIIAIRQQKAEYAKRHRANSRTIDRQSP